MVKVDNIYSVKILIICLYLDSRLSSKEGYVFAVLIFKLHKFEDKIQGKCLYRLQNFKLIFCIKLLFCYRYFYLFLIYKQNAIKIWTRVKWTDQLFASILKHPINNKYIDPLTFQITASSHNVPHTSPPIHLTKDKWLACQ